MTSSECTLEPQREINRPATPAAAVVSASLTLPNGSEIPLSTTDRWIGRDELRQALTSGGLQFVSREHILISYANGRFYVEDPRSSNGTRLNGNEIKGKGKFELKDGDVIELASEVKLAFKIL
jgi:pSer/pThr/pTyr-binding forkhead associated (FHA) protein